VRVIGHEAVRNQGNALFPCGSLELQQDQVNGFLIQEQQLALDRAKCQEISLEADVVERSETAGLASEHEKHQATCVPRSG
jgi:hypothetical protein